MATSPITPQTAISSNFNANPLIIPSDDVVSEPLIREFESILRDFFPDADKSFINDAAIVAAFLQSTTLFDSLFIREGDQRLRDRSSASQIC